MPKIRTCAWHKNAKKTVGRLSRANVRMNKRSRSVSKKRHFRKRSIKKHHKSRKRGRIIYGGEGEQWKLNNLFRNMLMN